VGGGAQGSKGLEQGPGTALGGTDVALRLKEAGLRVTKSRLAVYEALVSLGAHRSAEEVHRALGKRGTWLSRTTVYGALETFSRTGIVMSADAGPGRCLYEARAHWHHHAVCRVCGSVSDVDCVVGAKPCLEASGDWGDVDEAQVIFRGTCRRCASKRLRAAPGRRRRPNEQEHTK
jgi:Fe2+ or Zn2+ uptake regulation protein